MRRVGSEGTTFEEGLTLKIDPHEPEYECLLKFRPLGASVTSSRPSLAESISLSANHIFIFP